MGFLFVFVVTTVCSKLISVAKHSGTAFVELEPAIFYTEKQPTLINIKLPSPRVTLNYLAYGNCFVCDGEVPVDQCEPQFAAFDERVLGFLKDDLVLRNIPEPTQEMISTKQALKATNHMRESSCKIESAENSNEKKPKSVTYDNGYTHSDFSMPLRPFGPELHLLEGYIPSRNRRVEPVTMGIIAAVTAAGGYFIGNSQSVAIKQRLRVNENAILNLNRMVEEAAVTATELAEFFDAEPSLVLVGDPDLPFDIRAESGFIQKGAIGTKYDTDRTFHISRHAAKQYDDFKHHVLTLQNQRLPLDETFLLAIRAKCLSLQTGETDKIIQFCNEFAFHTTRWDTSLEFQGVGLNFLDMEQSQIDGIIYSFQIDIPVLDDRELEHLRIINLGRFKPDSSFARVELPSHAVINRSGRIHGLKTDQCTLFKSMQVCPPNSILSHDDCLTAVFNGTSSTKCTWQTSIIDETCISEVLETSVIVSLTKPSQVNFDVLRNRHMEKQQHVDSFDIVNRTMTAGQIQCEKTTTTNFVAELQIPKRPRRITATFSHRYISDVKLMQDFKMQPYNHSDFIGIRNDLEHLKQETAENSIAFENARKNENSTLQIMGDKIKSRPSKIENGVSNVWKHWTSLVHFGVTILLILAILILIKYFLKAKNAMTQLKRNRPRFRIPTNLPTNRDPSMAQITMTTEPTE